MKEPSYEEILQGKIDYYGETRAAYQFAAEEYAKQYHEWKQSPQLGLLPMPGFRINFMKNDFMEKGTAILLLHTEDYEIATANYMQNQSQKHPPQQ